MGVQFFWFIGVQFFSPILLQFFLFFFGCPILTTILTNSYISSPLAPKEKRDVYFS